MLVHFLMKNCLSLCLLFTLLGMVACKATKETQQFVVVNVLDKNFYEDCHIEGSINVPFMELEKYADEHWDKNKTQIVLYCGNYKCTASGFGAKMLREKGYKYAWAYEGGTAEWLHKGFPVVGPSTEFYLKDYELPEDIFKKMQQEEHVIISAEDLYKKIQEFK